ncbi:MAG: MBOAT family protein [Firmicutes bacterium]|nr:MBOAT family protein [Candidatus Colimorpha enterica]
MGFSSEIFLFLFLPISVIAYLIADRIGNMKGKNITLLVLSALFYLISGSKTFILFAALTVGVYMVGSLVHYAKKSEEGKNAGIWMALSVICLGLYLLAYKYMPFVNEKASALLEREITVANVIVPIGVSFFIFEAISYIVDIWRGDAEPGSFVEAALFLSLFPKLVSGPIVLWKDFCGEVKERSTKNADIAEGINRIIIGLAKKVIIADTLGAQLSVITGEMAGSVFDWQTIWLKGILYFFQIYFDFSGYSDIAIGLSRIFGFRFKENFNFPYLSTSVSDFWRRWHISLGSWFREYVYIPLGGNRRGNVYLNLFVVFLLTGIWHGNSLVFLVWGAYNGIFVVIDRLLGKVKAYKYVPSVIKWVFTVAIVYFGWILFMNPNMAGAIADFKKMFSFTIPDNIDVTWKYFMTKKSEIALMIASVGSLLGVIPLKAREKIKSLCAENAVCSIVQKAVYIVIFAAAIIFIVNSTYSPFLYFQF